MRYSERGNALVYVLIGVALFAALSYTLTRNAQTGNTGLDNEKSTLYANQIISHSQQVGQVVQQMLMTGSTINDIDFVKPGEAGYTTAPHQHKAFHPSGGGAPIFNDANEDLFEKANANRGWQGQAGTNIEWTATTANDLIYSFLYVSGSICAKINNILNGNETIPADSNLDFSVHFINGGGDDDTLETADCAGCESVYSQCVLDSGTDYIFYNVIASQ